MREICMSGSMREGKAAVIGLRAFHSVLSSLLYWLKSFGSGFPRCVHLPLPSLPFPQSPMSAVRMFFSKARRERIRCMLSSGQRK